MKMSMQSFRLLTLALTVALVSSGASFRSALAQDDKPAEAQEKGDAEAASEEEAEEEDPYAIPEEASAEEIKELIAGFKQIRPKNIRTRADMTNHYKELLPAVIKASEMLLEKSPEDEVAALTEKFSALSALRRYVPAESKAFEEFVELLAADERKEVSVLGASELLSRKAATLNGADEDTARQLSKEAVAFCESYGMTRQTYGAVSSIARSLGYSEYTNVGAELYESLAVLMAKSEDAMMQERADSMVGAARRLRLPGSVIEVFGTTGAGDEFKWDDYKGKVVLVDFWASWCGPCIGELPSMKKNLAAYGERGFEIVGINMDSTREAYEKCIADKEITWTNIVADGDNMGWKAPMATHYGITGIPTAILVNQEGKVVSLRARGVELDKQLAELLGPIEEETEDTEEAEETEEDDK